MKDIRDFILWFIFVICLGLIFGCSTSKDYGSHNHSYMRPLPDYWEADMYERQQMYRINRVERRIRKVEKQIQKDIDIDRPKVHRPIRDNQEPKVRRDYKIYEQKKKG